MGLILLTWRVGWVWGVLYGMGCCVLLFVSSLSSYLFDGFVGIGWFALVGLLDLVLIVCW